MISRRDFLLSSVATSAGLLSGPASLIAAGKCEGGEPACNANACYTRMFPKLARSSSIPKSSNEEGLGKLGELMMDDGNPESGDVAPVTAGYTYLGQFIDHDLTLDITPLELAKPSAECIRNFRTPFLDLDHLYGGGPSLSPFLYETNGPPGNERFLIGMTRNRRFNGRDQKPSADDLPRNSNGIALVGDPRQDENLIIAQLHVAFLKFHNRVMCELDKGKKGAVQSVGPAGATQFEQARRLVIWHYQYVVLNDFLRLLIDREVFDDLRRKLTARLGRSECFQIPIEFSVAAFRFGHSMVRDLYNMYNDDHENVSLSCLLALTGSGSKQLPCEDPGSKDIPFVLPADWVIEWSHFFLPNPPRPQVNEARRIDTKIAKGLHDLKIETIMQFNAAMANEPQKLTSPKNILPVRTLWRGARMGLASGQDIAKALGIKPLNSEDEIAPAGGLQTDILRTYGLDRDTPLWYYILREAEISKTEGTRLGPVGSRIVGEVIAGALGADPNSFLSINPNWKPTLPGRRGEQSDNMAAVLRFAAGKCDRR